MLNIENFTKPLYQVFPKRLNFDFFSKISFLSFKCKMADFEWSVGNLLGTKKLNIKAKAEKEEIQRENWR